MAVGEADPHGRQHVVVADGVDQVQRDPGAVGGHLGDIQDLVPHGLDHPAAVAGDDVAAQRLEPLHHGGQLALGQPPHQRRERHEVGEAHAAPQPLLPHRRVGVGDHARRGRRQVPPPGIDQERLELVGQLGDLARGGQGGVLVGLGAGGVVALVGDGHAAEVDLALRPRAERLGEHRALPHRQPVRRPREGPGQAERRLLVELAAAHEGGHAPQRRQVELGEHRLPVLVAGEAEGVPEALGGAQGDPDGAGHVAAVEVQGAAEQLALHAFDQGVEAGRGLRQPDRLLAGVRHRRLLAVRRDDAGRRPLPP